MPKNETSKQLNPLKSKQLYLLLEYLWDHAFCDYRLSSKDILNGLLQARPRVPHAETPSSAEKEWQTPPESAIKDLLDNAPDPSGLKIQPTYTHNPNIASGSQKKNLDRELEFAQDFTADRSLVSFRIVQHDKDDLERMALDDSNKKGYYHLTYSYDPAAVGMNKEDFTSDDYLHQISVRWQYALDLIYDFPYISIEDAKALRNMLSRLHTLGEIPERSYDNISRSEGINFEVLSRILRPLHKARKRKSINGENSKIPLLRITMGTYAAVDGVPTLASGESVDIYPVCTCVWNGIYYLAVRFPNKKEDEPRYDYLRIDHILDCQSLAGSRGKNTITYDDLGTPPSVEQLKGGTTQQFTLINCPDSTLIEIIDTFGKASISAAEKEDGLWRFNVTIPEKRKKLLYFLHNPDDITPVETQNQLNSSALDLSSYKAHLHSLIDRSALFHPASLKLSENSDAHFLDLANAIRENNTEKVNSLLDQWSFPVDAEDASLLRYIALPLNSDIYQRILELGPQPGPLSVSLPFLVTLNGSVKNMRQYLSTAAAMYDYSKSLEILLRFDEPIQETIVAAIENGSINCLNYLLEHHKDSFFETLEDGTRTLTTSILTALAKIGANDRVNTGCQIIAEKLLNCQLIDNLYVPHPDCIRLPHIAMAQNYKLLKHYLELQLNGKVISTRELTKNSFSSDITPDESAKRLAAADKFDELTILFPLFAWTARANKYPDDVIETMLLAERNYPNILQNNYFKTILLVTALSPRSADASQLLRPLLCKMEPLILLQDDCPFNALAINWFGRQGILANWKAFARKVNADQNIQLRLGVDRNRDILCDPARIDRRVLDTILSQFVIVGDAPDNELSKLAKLALKYASIDKIAKSKLLETENPQSLKNYRSNLEELSSISASRSEKIITLLKNTTN